MNPAASTLSAEPPTTAATTPEIAITEIHGMAGSTGAMTLGSSMRTTRPPTTGISTICRMLMAIAPPSTGMNWPASTSVSAGVRIGASSVDTDVMVTDRAVSALAR